MKRTLLLALFQIFTTPTLIAATIWEPTDQRFSTEDGCNNPLINNGITDFVGNIRQVKDGYTSYSTDVINIGTYAGEGTLTIDAGITADAGNCVFIGGRGWHADPQPEDKPALNESDGFAGTLNVQKGAVFSNGVDSNLTTYAGAQFIVGQGNAKGTLNIDGGTVNSNGGVFIVGNSSRSEGIVNITNGGVLNANLPTNITNDNNGSSWFLMGYESGAKATVNVESGSSLTVSTDKPNTAASTFIGYMDGSDCSINVSGGSKADFGDSTFVGVYGKGSLTAQNQGTVIETGNLYLYNANSYAEFSEGVTVDADGDLFVAGTLENSGSLTVSGKASFVSGSTTNNSGTLQAENIYIYSDAVVTNTGILKSGDKGDAIYLYNGASINNKGTLSGTISGSGTVYGDGKLGTISVGKGTMLTVASENAPIHGLKANSITLMAGSVTHFNVAGSIDAPADTSADWDSDMHSVIFGETVTIQSGALIEIVFNSDMFTPGEATELDMLLFSGSANSDYGDLETLINNTVFSLYESGMTRRLPDTLSLHTGNLSYQVRDSSLYLVGSAMVTVPEPTTSALSLLTLAALAARRQRR